MSESVIVVLNKNMMYVYIPIRRMDAGEIRHPSGALVYISALMIVPRLL